MSGVLQGHLLSGDNLAARPVAVTADAGDLQINGDELSLRYNFSEVRCSDRIGRVPRYLYLPDGRTVETPDNDIVDTWLASRHRGRVAGTIHWLEQRARIAAIATIVLIVSVAALGYFGLPALARRAAFLVPASIEKSAGDAAVKSIRRFLAPSQLSLANRARVEKQLDRLVAIRPLDPKPHLEFWSMGGKNPNAFALPGGFIVMTDELVALAKDDDELAAVLAHEIGHHVNRHGLQSVFRGSAALLVVSTVTGDLSTLTTFSSTLPFILLQRGYSREFEAEADDYAIELLLAAHIDPHKLAQILTRLEAEHNGDRQDFSYLSTHPSTSDRIRLIDARQHAFAVESGLAAPTAVPFSLDLTGEQARKGREAATEFGPDDNPPQLVSAVNPEYPIGLRAANIQGSVTVEYIVAQDGSVGSVQVLHSTHHDFEAPAVAAVLRWKFKPGWKKGQKVDTRVQQVLTFNLTNDQSPEQPLGPTPPKS